MNGKIKRVNVEVDELHACGMAMLENLLEQKRDFTGDNAVALNIPVTMPDESKRTITIGIYEANL